jgi:hypothetical protein
MLVTVLMLLSVVALNLSASSANHQQIAFATVSAGPFDMCDWISKGCETEAKNARYDCEYRNEGSGTGYASCGCQAVRAYKTCMENYGCTDHPRLTWEVEQNKECITDQ